MLKRIPALALILVLVALAVPCVTLADGQHVEKIAEASGGADDVGIALDAHGLPWIAYFDRSDLRVHVMHRTPDGWAKKIIYPSINYGGTLPMAVDNRDRVHMMTCQIGMGVSPVVYWLRDDEGWHGQLITQGSIGRQNMVVDGDGYPHITYRNGYFAPDIHYTWQDAQGWYTTTIPSTGSSFSGDTPLVLDDQGLPIVATNDTGVPPSKVFCWDGTTWSSESWTTPGKLPKDVRTVYRPEFGLEIISWQVMDPQIALNRRGESVWEKTVIAEYPLELLNSINAMVGPDGEIHLTMPRTESIRWIQSAATGWMTTTVPFQQIGYGAVSRADIDGEGRIHMVCTGGSAVYYLVLSDYVEPTPQLDAHLSVSPATFGPGWNLYYTLTMTNTGPFDLAGVVAEAPVPEGACLPANLPDTDLPGEIADDGITWEIGDLPRDGSLRLTHSLHTMSYLADGATLTGTASISSTTLSEAVVVGAAAVCDASLAPTATPSPTAAVTPHAAWLPMVVKDGT